MLRRRGPTGPGPPPALTCPGCGGAQPSSARFCPRCGLPLIFEGAASDATLSERHAWARKIKPQLAEGDLVSAARARNQVEAEFIQSLLLEEGVPSLLRRSAGFDVPDFLAAGPRDVLVPAAGLETAREVLLQAELVSDGEAARRAAVTPLRLLAGLLVALALGALLVWVLGQAIR
jgi:hypothetical protein